MELRVARKRKGLTQSDLADLLRVGQPTVAAFETGGRRMGDRFARKAAAVLDESPAQLMIGNRLAAMQRAINRDDAAGVIEAVKTVVGKTTDGMELTSEGEKALDELVQGALAFTQLVKEEDGQSL
jgi:transcriptional regulator with XRE-family HTH domain